MNPRKSCVLAFVASLALLLTSCGTARRAGKDLGVVAVSPALVLYGGFTDAYTTAKEVRNGLGGGPVVEVITMIPAAVVHTVKHAIYVVFHAVDFVLFPVYGAAELHPYGPEIEPLDYYTGTIFDKETKRSATDASSGEASSGTLSESTPPNMGR